MNPKSAPGPSDKQQHYTQACRDAAFLFQKVKHLPWADSRHDDLHKMLAAAESIRGHIQFLIQAETLIAQSANAVKSQPSDEPREEHQNT